MEPELILYRTCDNRKHWPLRKLKIEFALVRQRHHTKLNLYLLVVAEAPQNEKTTTIRATHCRVPHAPVSCFVPFSRSQSFQASVSALLLFAPRWFIRKVLLLFVFASLLLTSAIVKFRLVAEKPLEKLQKKVSENELVCFSLQPIGFSQDVIALLFSSGYSFYLLCWH